MKLSLHSKKSNKKKANTNKKSGKQQEKVSKKDLFYTDISELPKNFNRKYITLDRLCYKHIIYCDVLSIRLGEQEIELVQKEEIQRKLKEDNISLYSWVRLLLLMLSTIHANHPDNFIDYLMNKGITNQEFCVDTKYGKYTFDKMNYKAFKIFNTNFYLEAIFNFDIIYKALINMLNVLGMDKKETSIQLINNAYNSNDKVIYELEQYCQVHTNVQEALSRMNNNSSIKGVKILGLGVEITCDSMIPIVFINILRNVYKDNQEEVFDKLCKIGKTKVLKEQSDKIKENCHIITLNNNKKYYLYSDGKKESIFRFLITSMNNLNIDFNEFTVYIHYLTEYEKGEF